MAEISSATGIISEDMMQPNRKGDVLRLLFSLAIPAKHKAQLFGAWARDVGIAVRGNEIMALKRSGTDGEGAGLDKVG